MPEGLRQLALDDPRSWLIASAGYFQGPGYYTEYLDLSDDELPHAIREAVRWQWDGPLPPEEVARDLQLADMVLLLGDRRRVWWRDLEGVFAGEDFYVASLIEWSAISRGAFEPTRITERWHSDEGPADIEFVLGGQRCVVTHPNRRDDFLNIAIISDINRLIGDSGYRFAVCDNLGMPNWVVTLLRARSRTHFGATGAGPSSRCNVVDVASAVPTRLHRPARAAASRSRAWKKFFCEFRPNGVMRS